MNDQHIHQHHHDYQPGEEWSPAGWVEHNGNGEAKDGKKPPPLAGDAGGEAGGGTEGGAEGGAGEAEKEEQEEEQEQHLFLITGHFCDPYPNVTILT